MAGFLQCCLPFEEKIKSSCQVSVRANIKALRNNRILNGKPQVDFFQKITFKEPVFGLKDKQSFKRRQCK